MPWQPAQPANQTAARLLPPERSSMPGGSGIFRALGIAFSTSRARTLWCGEDRIERLPILCVVGRAPMTTASKSWPWRSGTPSQSRCGVWCFSIRWARAQSGGRCTRDHGWTARPRGRLSSCPMKPSEITRGFSPANFRRRIPVPSRRFADGSSGNSPRHHGPVCILWREGHWMTFPRIRDPVAY